MLAGRQVIILEKGKMTKEEEEIIECLISQLRREGGVWTIQSMTASDYEQALVLEKLLEECREA